MIHTTYPPCPDCGRPMRLVHDAEETLRGAPRTWWCPDCTTHVRRHGDVWDILDVAADGRLWRRATPTAGGYWVHAIQAVLADPRLHPSTKTVYAALVTRSVPDRAGTATMQQIAEWTGLSRMQVWRALRELRDARLVEWQGRAFRPGAYRLAGPGLGLLSQHVTGG